MNSETSYLPLSMQHVCINFNPDTALERTNKKFIKRFGYVEQQAREMEKKLKDMTLTEMDKLWDEAKQLENPEVNHSISNRSK